MPEAVPLRAFPATLVAESIAPVTIWIIRSNSADSWNVCCCNCPKLNGWMIVRGSPLVSMVLPALTSSLVPRGIRVASIAIIGCVVRAKASIRPLNSASNAF